MKTNNKLSSQKYEQLIHEYQSKISSILKINNDLSNEANDLINSIYLNRDIISEYLKDFPEFKPLEKNLFSSIETYLYNIEEKKNLETQLNKIEHFQQNLPEEVELLQLNNEILKNDLYKILKKIYKIQKELEKQKKNSIYKITREEVFIVSPTKKNIELVDLINKLNKELEVNNCSQEIDKRKLRILDAKIRIIEEQVDKLNQPEIINNNDEDDANEDEEIDEFDPDEKGEEDEINDFYEVKDFTKNRINTENKNIENENLELIEQIKYFKNQVEKLEYDNNKTKNKIKEYDNEYKKLKEELKVLEINSLKNNDNTNNKKLNSIHKGNINNKK